MKETYEEVCKHVDILTKKDTRKLTYEDYKQATIELKKKFDKE
jgi:hypothetical protein